MHRQLIRRLSTVHSRDQRGAIAIVMAASMVLLCVIAGLVLDIGLVQADRQVDQSAADSSALAGLHGLNNGDGNPHPYAGVCTAIQYLAVNSPRLSGLTSDTGWTDGLGAATASGCTDTTLRAKTCSPTDKSTWAAWKWTGTSNSVTFDVTIQSGYVLNGGTFPNDTSTLPASSSDTSYAGCDQLAVIINQRRAPGFGSLAISGPIKTTLRSVGRVKLKGGNAAPALLLLKRNGCPVLRTGSNGGQSFVHVLGQYSAASGVSQPGTIHADSDGSGCTGGSNSNVFVGNATDGIVAYAAPTVGSLTTPDPSQPGLITSVAALANYASGIVRDSIPNVHGTSVLNGAGGTYSEVQGRSLIGRTLVDNRYFTSVKGALSGAKSVFLAGQSGPITGWKTFPSSVNACKPSQADVNSLNLTATDNLYINCTAAAGKFVGDAGGLTINAGGIYFNTWVNPSAQVNMPNANHVYVANRGGNSDAISLGTGSAFQMHTAGVTTGTGSCTTGQNSGTAVLFVRSGDFKQSSGTLRMCRTTMFLMGGADDGCVPAIAGTAPTSSPCDSTNNAGYGSGQLSQSGGDVDWTAPDTIDLTTDASGNTLPTATTAWNNVNGPEDLALWAESGTNSTYTYNMGGTGYVSVRGVFMIPNGLPFIISGGATLNLHNAQFITGSIELNGSNTNITMDVDPNSAITIPQLGYVGLVR